MAGYNITEYRIAIFSHLQPDHAGGVPQLRHANMVVSQAMGRDWGARRRDDGLMRQTQGDLTGCVGPDPPRTHNGPSRNRSRST